jgi:hypothetical protein
MSLAIPGPRFSHIPARRPIWEWLAPGVVGTLVFGTLVFGTLVFGTLVVGTLVVGTLVIETLGA